MPPGEASKPGRSAAATFPGGCTWKTLLPSSTLSVARPEYHEYSVFIMFRHLALHDFLHAYRIEELLLRPDWAV